LGVVTVLLSKGEKALTLELLWSPLMLPVVLFLPPVFAPALPQEELPLLKLEELLFECYCIVLILM